MEADFGGLVATGQSIKGLGDNQAANQNSTIKKVLGAVLKVTNDFYQSLKGCSSLERIDMIGWSAPKAGRYIYDMCNGCAALVAIDLSGIPFSNVPTECSQLFEGCASLKHIIFPDDMSGVSSIKQWYRMNNGSINTNELTVSGGKLTAVTNMQNFAQKGYYKVLDISNIDCNTVTSISNGLFQAQIDTLIIGNLGMGNLADKTSWIYSTTLNKIVCKSATPPAVNTDCNWLEDLPSNTKIYVPDASVNDYKTAAGWSVVASKIYSINDME